MVLAIWVMTTTSGCALLLRGAAVGVRGAGVAGAARVGAGAARVGAVAGASVSAPAGAMLFGRGPVVAAGIGALALGRALPAGTAKMYGPTGDYLGQVESRGATAIYYDNLGRPAVRSEQIGSTMRFYDATGRYIGHSSPAASHRVNFYSAEGELAGYEVLDSSRIVWHFDANGTLIGYTILGEVDLAALGLRSDAFGFGLSAAVTAALLGRDDDKRSPARTMGQTDQPIQALSPRVVESADNLFSVADKCRTSGDLDSCRLVSVAHADLSDAMREEFARLSKPTQNKLK